MDKLPVEILQDIFDLSLSHEYRLGQGELSPFFTMPLILSHVCRYWRQAAISFGTLWTYLEIHYDLPRIKYDMVHTWIERTNGLSLDFVIDFRLDDDNDIEQRRTLEFVTKLLLAEQYRWRDVRFSWNFKAFTPEFTRIDISDLPALLSMSLDINIRKCDDGERIFPTVSLARSEWVESVSFESEYDIEYGAKPLQYRIEGQQYFRNWVGWRAADTCLEELGACPNLQRFYAHYVGWGFEDDGWEMSSSRPHLVHGIEHLVLDHDGGSFPELVISKVTLPNLRILDFKTTSFLETESVLPGFFQRSKPPLERLELFGKCAQHQNLIPALRHLPSLRTLTIESCESPELIFEGLSSTVDDDIICPNLLCLRLKEYGNPDYVPDPRRALDALCTMVELRVDPKSPGRIKVNDDFVIPTSHMRREVEVILQRVSMITGRFNDLSIHFEGLAEL